MKNKPEDFSKFWEMAQQFYPAEGQSNSKSPFSYLEKSCLKGGCLVENESDIKVFIQVLSTFKFL